MHSSTTHHLCIVLCVHHPKSSLLLSPFIPSLPTSTSTHPLSPQKVLVLVRGQLSGWGAGCKELLRAWWRWRMIFSFPSLASSCPHLPKGQERGR